MHTRRLLKLDHAYRFKKNAFDGTVEEEFTHRPLPGTEVHNQVKDIETIFGKPVNEID